MVRFGITQWAGVRFRLTAHGSDLRLGIISRGKYIRREGRGWSRDTAMELVCV